MNKPKNVHDMFLACSYFRIYVECHEESNGDFPEAWGRPKNSINRGKPMWEKLQKGLLGKNKAKMESQKLVVQPA